MNRRSFITLLGGAAATWPLVVRAQQAAMPVIGFLNSQLPEAFPDRLRAFHRGLKETGYVEGDNVTIVYRSAENQNDRLPMLASDLVSRQVTLIAAVNTAAALAAKAATTAIPIVFNAAEDPVKLGLVTSLARPSGNLTGVNAFSRELVAKRLELLHQLVPAATRVAVIVNPKNAAVAEPTLRDVGPAAGALGLQIQILNASTSQEIDAAFVAFGRDRPDALFVANDVFLASRRVQVVNLTSRYSIPATFHTREYAEVGGLMSYGSNLADSYRQVGAYAGRILKGAKPADLPVIQSTKLELVINHATARLLGLTVPPTLLATADEVIE